MEAEEGQLDREEWKGAPQRQHDATATTAARGRKGQALQDPKEIQDGTQDTPRGYGSRLGRCGPGDQMPAASSRRGKITTATVILWRRTLLKSPSATSVGFSLRAGLA